MAPPKIDGFDPNVNPVVGVEPEELEVSEALQLKTMLDEQKGENDVYFRVKRVNKMDLCNLPKQ